MKRRSNPGRTLRGVVVSLAGLILMGCEQPAAPPASTDAEAAAAPAPVNTPALAAVPAASDFRWFAIAPAALTQEGPDAQFTLAKGGSVQAVFDKRVVEKGAKLRAAFSISGTEGATVRAVLTRHCNPENGDSADGAELTLTAAPQDIDIPHTFLGSFSCVRVDFTSSSATPVSVTISNLVLAKE